MKIFQKSIFLVLCYLFAANSFAIAPQPIITQDWTQIPFVNASDPQVIGVANFAVKEIKRGSLYKIVYAQQQKYNTGVVYILTLELVDAHIIHHMYSVQVYVPNEGTDWQVIYFTPTKY